MPKLEKLVQQFIESIPDSKLQSFVQGTIYKDDDFRLDLQGSTTGGGLNFQVQANKQASDRAVRALAANSNGWTTVSTVVLAQGAAVTGAVLKDALIENINVPKPQTDI